MRQGRRDGGDKEFILTVRGWGPGNVYGERDGPPRCVGVPSDTVERRVHSRRVTPPGTDVSEEWGLERRKKIIVKSVNMCTRI